MAKRLGWYLAEQLILKITLVDSAPKIWRRVEVHSGLTLHDLHIVIQCVFDWNNSHLYQFFAPPGGKLTRRAMIEATRYHVLPPDPVFGEEMKADQRADEELVGRVFKADQKQIIYEYDFGDSWNHLVKVEKRIPGGEQDHIPICLAGENAAPIDDLGGIYGYYHWANAAIDQASDGHDDAIEWLGEDFDLARFDLNLVNQRLAAAFRPVPKRPRKPRRKPE